MAAQCNQHLAVPQEGPGYTEELPFSHREVLPVLRHLRVEGMRQLADLWRDTQEPNCEDRLCVQSTTC